jgi:hypothetical protein
MAQLTLTGRNIRWYFNGQNVGMSRVTSLKPDTTQGLDAVKECGNPNIVEYAQKVPETSLSFAYTVISKKQLALAMGLTLSNGATGEVPNLPLGFDIVERRIQPGTEGTTSEVYLGWTIYQGVQIEKTSWDQEVDKLIAANLSAKCIAPRDFEGINGIQYDKFIGNGSTTTFVLSKFAIPLKDGTLIIRAEAPTGTVLKYGASNDYTAASTSSTTSITFNVAPASATSNNILVAYGW